MEKVDKIPQISLIDEEDMRAGRGKKSYEKLSVSRKEKAAFKFLKFEILEKGMLEGYESGTTVGPHGFLIHHFGNFRTEDGKVHGLRCEGGNTYPQPIQHEGQQKTTCADCGKDVLLHIDFQPGDVPERNGAYCYDCIVGHSERRISLTIYDLKLRFKTVYKHNKGAMITNEGVMRTYSGKAWIDEDGLEFGDSFIILKIVDDSSGIFTNNCIFVATINGAIKGPVEEYLKEFIPIIEPVIIDTTILECDICGFVHKLSSEELEEVSNFIIKHGLKGIDYLDYMDLAKGKSCKNNTRHKFKFEHEFEKLLFGTIKIIESATKEHNESIAKKEKLEKERDDYLAENIKLMQKKDELAKKMEEINKQMGELTIKMDESTKDINIESNKAIVASETEQKMNEKLYQLTKMSDIEFWL